MDSILTSVKKLLGLTEDYEYFDEDIKIHINSVFSVLTQLGVGPETGFIITGKTETWDDYIPGVDRVKLDMIKSYVYLRVRLLFDPPTSSFLIEAMNKQVSEFEWRLNVAVDPKEDSGG